MDWSPDSDAHLIDSVVSRFRRFLTEKQRSMWIHAGPVAVYVRKSTRYMSGTGMPALDIANISIDDPYKGRGIGTALINAMAEAHPYSMTYIESIINEKFGEHLIGAGWTPHPNAVPLSVYQIK